MDNSTTLLIIEVVGTLGVLLTVVLMYIQIRRTTLYTRANFKKDLFLSFYRDPWMRDAFYSIEYGDFTYNTEFHGSDLERKIDYMLGYLDLLGYLVKSNVLDLSDIEPLWYEIYRIFTNKDIMKYIRFLEKWYEKNGIKRRPFDGFMYLGKNIIKLNTFEEPLKQ